MEKKVIIANGGKKYEVEPTFMEYLLAGEKPVIQPYDPNAIFFTDDNGNIRTAIPVKEEKTKETKEELK